MNDLIVSVVKERILPLTSDFIDYPSAPFETHLYHISTHLTKSILDNFVLVTHWSLCNASVKNTHSITEESRMTLALQNTFPHDWLAIAEKSPTYHLHLQRIIQRYRFTLHETSIQRIHRIVEFFCFELIESTVIHAAFKPMFQLTVSDLERAVERDPVFSTVLHRHRIFFISRCPSTALITFVNFPSSVQVSIKGLRLLRVFVEELIRQVFQHRRHESTLTYADIHDYFKHHRPLE